MWQLLDLKCKLVLDCYLVAFVFKIRLFLNKFGEDKKQGYLLALLLIVKAMGITEEEVGHAVDINLVAPNYSIEALEELIVPFFAWCWQVNTVAVGLLEHILEAYILKHLIEFLKLVFVYWMT